MGVLLKAPPGTKAPVCQTAIQLPITAPELFSSVVPSRGRASHVNFHWRLVVVSGQSQEKQNIGTATGVKGGQRSAPPARESDVLLQRRTVCDLPPWRPWEDLQQGPFYSQSATLELQLTTGGCLVLTSCYMSNRTCNMHKKTEDLGITAMIFRQANQISPGSVEPGSLDSTTLQLANLLDISFWLWCWLTFAFLSLTGSILSHADWLFICAICFLLNKYVITLNTPESKKPMLANTRQP